MDAASVGPTENAKEVGTPINVLSTKALVLTLKSLAVSPEVVTKYTVFAVNPAGNTLAVNLTGWPAVSP